MEGDCDCISQVKTARSTRFWSAKPCKVRVKRCIFLGGSGGQMGLVLSTVVGDISGSYGVLRWIAQRGLHKMNTIE